MAVRLVFLGKLADLAGTPERVADLIEDWFTTGAADGFNIMPPVIYDQLELFASEVIPLLQKRGLFRWEYRGRTLREHFGLGLVGSGQPFAESA